MREPLPKELLIEAWKAIVGCVLERCLTQRACPPGKSRHDQLSAACSCIEQRERIKGGERERRGTRWRDMRFLTMKTEWHDQDYKSPITAFNSGKLSFNYEEMGLFFHDCNGSFRYG